jgi:hypothetical protein
MRFGVIVLVVAVAVSACQTGSKSKRPISSIPMEAVDVETNGQRGGDTHFHLGPGEVFLSYETLGSPLSANQKVEEGKAKAIRVIEEGEVPGGGDASQGVYILVESESRHENTRYCLYWSKTVRHHSVCSASIQPIEHFRALYEL